MAEILEGGADLAHELCAAALELQEFDTKGSLLSNDWHSNTKATSSKDYERSGYSSFANFNLITSYVFERIHSATYQGVRKYLAESPNPMTFSMTNSWVSIYGRGHWVPEHTHPLSHLSLVFYGAAPGGDIVFKNPALPIFSQLYGGSCHLFPQAHTVTPEDGMLIVFPSFIPHGTTPNDTDSKRIIFSANIVFDDCPQLGQGPVDE